LLIAAEAGVVLGRPGGVPGPELTLAAGPPLWPEFSARASAALPVNIRRPHSTAASELGG
jgi:hypothetical protein